VALSGHIGDIEPCPLLGNPDIEIKKVDAIQFNETGAARHQNIATRRAISSNRTTPAKGKKLW
jgi:hypothetical protein